MNCFCNSVALIFLCLMLVLAGVRCLLCNFYQFSRCAKPVTKRKIFSGSNPAPSLITANQNSLPLSRVLMLSVTDQWATGHSRFIIAIESSKILADPPPPHLSVYLHLHVLRRFYFCTFIFDVPSFCCLAYQFLAHVVLA